MKKRDDLQGIRGIAISSVLLYHFFPATFKNGYVGVDQFFILSGFLMAEILSRDASISASSLFAFYYRRLRRIVPLYAIFVLFTLFSIKLAFPLVFFTFNVPYAIRSLLFVNNIQLGKKRFTYEQMLANAEVLYTHTWSLSCEVQFYIIAPFILVMPTGFPKNLLLSLIALISYFSFTFIWETDLQELAFNYMFTRIWQFIVGCLCSILNKKEETLIEKRPLLMKAIDDVEIEHASDTGSTHLYSFLSHLNCVSLLILCLFPIELSPHYVRLLACIQTSVLIYTGSSIPNFILSNQFIVYLGDISYSLYLIHWPVCVISRQKQLDSFIGSLFAIVFCLLLASLAFKYFEKFYLKLDKTNTFCLCILLYLCCFGFIALMTPLSILSIYQAGENLNITTSEYPKIPENLTVETAIGLNTKFSNLDSLLLNVRECSYAGAPWESVCTFDNQNFFGSKRLMIIGNSFAANIARMFIKLEECQEKASEITMYSKKGCEVLEDSGYRDAECKNMTEKYQEVVENAKPDVLFIITRHMDSMQPSKGPVDNILKMEKMLLTRLETKVNQRVFILNAYPRQISQGFTNSINAGLRDGQTVDQKSLVNTRIQYLLARKRMEILAKECTKCELIDIMPELTKNGTFQFYDEENGLEYFTDSLHLTQCGLQKISKVFKKACNKIVH